MATYGPIDDVSTTPDESQTDRLAAAVAGPEDHETITALWRAAFSLDIWYAVPVTTEDCSGPATVQIDGSTMLLAFTSEDGIRQFMIRQGMADPDGTLDVLAVRPRDVIAHRSAYEASAIDGIMMDPLDASFFLPLDSMEAMWERAMGDSAAQDHDDDRSFDQAAGSTN